MNERPVTSERITVLIVDDHAVVRQGVRAFLDTRAEIEVVGEAESGERAVEICAEHAPDVVLLDLLMPEMNGVETARQIKAVSPRSQIVILTSHHSDEHLLPSIRAGALSYLLKDISPPELVAAVEKASRGEAVLHPRIAAQIVENLQNTPNGAAPNPLMSLSRRESEVLRLIAEGLPNAQIATRLFISEKTVKSHVGNILGKLHLADRTQAAVYAWRSGFVEGEG
jgi:NarL family two-component system response regulator LiaR